MQPHFDLSALHFLADYSGFGGLYMKGIIVYHNQVMLEMIVRIVL